jgi:glycosyltransferase involved in cell wall biosynthesis
LQGDDVFLDTLTRADREAVLVEMRRIAGQIDGFIVFNRYYRDFMADLLSVPSERFHVVPLGLADPEGFHDSGRREEERPPTIGYLARICPEKGYHLLVEAFLSLRQQPATRDVRLKVAGWLGATDRDYFEKQRRRVLEAGAGDAFEHTELPDRESKIRWLGGLDLLSVPTIYREPKGIYVLEALAAGVPVVQPDHGSFPELLSGTGGGRLISPGDPVALAAALQALLVDPGERARLGEEGRRNVCESYRDETMALRTRQAWHDVMTRRALPGQRSA